MDVPQARRLERPAWLNGRTIVGIVLFTVSLVGGQRLIDGYRTTVPVWTARADLATGTVLEASDLIPSEANLPAELRARYALGETSLVGAVLTEPIAQGELVPLGSVAPAGTLVTGRLVSIPVQADHSVGGRIAPGDLIDLFVTFNPGDARARTEQLAASVEVVDVVTEQSIVAADGLPIAITLLVAPESVAEIVHASRTGELDVVKVTGSPSTELAEPVSAGD